MTKIENLDIIIDELNDFLPEDLNSLARPRKRLAELMLQIFSKNNDKCKDKNAKRLFINFLRSPLRIENLGKANLNRIELAVNEFVDNDSKFSENAKVKSTDKKESIDMGLLLRSIGYKAISIDKSIPINERTGVIDNESGLIKSIGNDVFCSGWAATGAQGNTYHSIR